MINWVYRDYRQKLMNELINVIACNQTPTPAPVSKTVERARITDLAYRVVKKKKKKKKKTLYHKNGNLSTNLHKLGERTISCTAELYQHHSRRHHHQNVLSLVHEHGFYHGLHVSALSQNQFLINVEDDTVLGAHVAGQ